MTTEPMSDERIAEIEAHRGNADEAMLSGCTDYACYCHFNLPELIAEIRRLKAAQVVPPDVLAAMEDYRRGSCMDSNALIIARHFTSRHGKDGA